MAGEGVGFPAVDPQVLVQLVFVPEGLAAVGAFKRTETFSDEKVLQRRVLKEERDDESRRFSDMDVLRRWGRLIDAMECAGVCIPLSVT